MSTKRKSASIKQLIALITSQTLHCGVSMLAETDLKRLFHKLIRQFSAKIHFFGSDITINFCDHASKVQLSTPVYLGTNYIPKSVRDCIAQSRKFPQSMRSFLTVDEDNYRVILNYAGALDRTEDFLFENLIEEFGSIAEEWRSLLDERDKNDLVYVYHK